MSVGFAAFPLAAFRTKNYLHGTGVLAV